MRRDVSLDRITISHSQLNIAAPDDTEMFATTDWRHSLSQAIRDPDDFIDKLNLPRELKQPAQSAAREFPLFVPLSYLARMRPSDVSDPLLKQVLPIGQELVESPGFGVDPVGDFSSRRAPGLLHKYAGRALLITTGACAVHCRYCFRRAYPYGDEPKTLDDWEPALATLRSDNSISEVLLSGGDPLMLTDSRLRTLIERLAAIPHLRRVRIHTRLPIVLPDRVTRPLIDLLTSTRLTPIVVVHANHPNEIVNDCVQALKALTRNGVTTFNQAVLLRDVNDDADTLTKLCERLIDLGVIPYYLHQLDRTRGTAHFEVAEDKGVALIQELRRRLPGYAVPDYVREESGALSKTSLMDGFVQV